MRYVCILSVIVVLSTATPELMAVTAQRFEHFADRHKDGLS